MVKWVLNIRTKILETEIMFRCSGRTGESIPVEETSVMWQMEELNKYNMNNNKLNMRKMAET